MRWKPERAIAAVFFGERRNPGATKAAKRRPADAIERCDTGLRQTLGLTGTPDLQDDDKYFYGDETTAWDNQHYEVRVQTY